VKNSWRRVETRSCR